MGARVAKGISSFVYTEGSSKVFMERKDAYYLRWEEVYTFSK